MSFEDFSGFVFELQTVATQKLSPLRIQEYLEIIKDSSGGIEMCTVVFHYVIVVIGKYLQMMVAYRVYNEQPNRVTDEFNRFNQKYEELVACYTDVTGLAFEAGNMPNPNSLKSKIGPMETKLKSKNESPETTPTEIDPEVMSFLRDLNLTELIGIFQREQLTMEDILEMNNNELNSMLKSIGVEKFKQRKAIVQVILCQRHSNYTANVYRDL